MDYTELDKLVRGWREYLAAHPQPDGNTRNAGFRSGLAICSEQLEETLQRLRADDEVQAL